MFTVYARRALNYVHLYVCMLAYAFMCTCVLSHVRVELDVYILAYVFIRAYLHTCIYTHTLEPPSLSNIHLWMRPQAVPLAGRWRPPGRSRPCARRFQRRGRRERPPSPARSTRRSWGSRSPFGFEPSRGSVQID